MDLIKETEQAQYRTDIPEFAPGDTVKVNVRIREGDRERLQAFEGVCTARQGGGLNESFTVRRVSHQVGVERTFPVHSPIIESVTCLRQGRVRRAKLYYLRDRVGKAARVKQKRTPRPERGAKPSS